MLRDKEAHPYHFGTYISNVATTIFYTYRLEPSLQACKSLHGL